MIHSTAIIHPAAQLHESVQIGPYSIIDEHVTVGAGCEFGPHVHVTGHTTIGAENRFHTGCVIGDEPQDLKYSGELTRLIIGERNLFRAIDQYSVGDSSYCCRVLYRGFPMDNSTICLCSWQR